MVQDPLLHLQAVGISVECAVVHDVRCVELDHYLFALGGHRDGAELKGPLREAAGLVGPQH